MDTIQAQAAQATNQAVAKAKQLGVPVNIAILDTAGHLKSFVRMDDAFLGAIEVSMGKAKTAMLFRMNSEAVGEFMDPKNKAYGLVNSNGGLIGFKGGMPVKTNAEIVAYIGVSGGTIEQDFEIASAGSVI